MGASVLQAIYEYVSFFLNVLKQFEMYEIWSSFQSRHEMFLNLQKKLQIV